MRPDRKRPEPMSATRRDILVPATFIAVPVVVFWIWRDGFSWGDVLGGLVIWTLTAATLAAMRWYRQR